jgi:hypothetical protein
MKTAFGKSQQTERVGEHAALARLDAALAAASHRGAYTRDEAISLLHEIVANVKDPDLVDPVLSIVSEALRAFDGQQLVDRWQVVNPLLDIRLVLEPIAALI